MLIGIYLVIISLLVLKIESAGKSCTLPSGGNGECIPLASCVSVLKNLSQGGRPLPCGFQGFQPLVCCPNVQRSEPIKNSKSKDVCNQYLEIAERPILGIINGLPAEAGEFPHMVALGFGDNNDIHWLCGGTLISDKFILTAAHCLSSPEYGAVKWARTGTFNLKEPEKGGFNQDFEITKIHRHPEYKPPSRYNDIALLELNKLVEFTRYVFPACINTELNTLKNVEAIGWGLVELAGDPSDHLLKVGLEVYNHDICNKSYSNVSKRLLQLGIVHESQVCAGGAKDESKDTCQGDSGGPLHALSKEAFIRVYKLIGVTSFGKGCGIVNTPGVYTRVSQYIPWIESVVWPK